MFRMAFAASFALCFATTPALAGDAEDANETPQATVSAEPAKPEPAPARRLTTLERWRGKPYLARQRGRAQGEDEGRLLVNSRIASPLGFESAQPGEAERRLLAAPVIQRPGF